MSTGWIPKEQRGTEWYLFNSLFKCRVPFQQSRSIENIKHYGTPSSGDMSRDKETASELVMRMLTIDQMLTYYKNGVPITVVDRKDTKAIYDIIHNHLLAWKNIFHNSLNPGDTQLLQDLVDLDAFANVVYAHAKFEMTKEFVDSVLAKRLGGAMRVTRGNLFNKPSPLPNENKMTQEEILAQRFPDRQSMGDIFARRPNGAQIKPSVQNFGIDKSAPTEEVKPGNLPMSPAASRWK